MIFITEAESSALVSHALAFKAVREALIAACLPAANSFPVVIGRGSASDARFTIKSASDPALAGLKVGSYFPSNDLQQMPRHSSITLLFDQSCGRIGTIVEGSRVNAYRTAAADAVATDALARQDACSLAIFGTGHQAFYEVEAISRIRELKSISVVGRSLEKAEALAARLRTNGLPARPGRPEQSCREADIVVTATTSREPLFEADWINQGTHISTMGSDGVGKQELPPRLFESARLCCDLPAQSREVGEFQHARDSQELIAIGSVLSGARIGREDPDAVTVFDSSGISLQDLYMANEIVAAWAQQRETAGSSVSLGDH
ncbi:ornithine cyclodeaminase family protein [Mesorhizobium sp. M0047]|uniref:ornithine cyclodeaminase family protein n=1 Tax=Mesorhizobium sp. M0047 TaxID=2956859 RepID=UPI003335596E